MYLFYRNPFEITEEFIRKYNNSHGSEEQEKYNELARQLLSRSKVFTWTYLIINAHILIFKISRGAFSSFKRLLHYITACTEQHISPKRSSNFLNRLWRYVFNKGQRPCWQRSPTLPLSRLIERAIMFFVLNAAQVSMSRIHFSTIFRDSSQNSQQMVTKSNMCGYFTGR